MSDDVLNGFSLAGRVAVVTGAASGIGRQAALTFVAAGAKVVVADIDEAGIAETAEAIDVLPDDSLDFLRHEGPEQS